MAIARRVGRSLPQQAFALGARFPDGKLSLSRGTLMWTGELTPTELSRTYLVRVRYRLGAAPKVTVVRPQLRTRPAEGLPHTYTGDLLCLHDDVDWTPTMALADAIVPWAAEWLMYYEIWLTTGTWEGGGQWPPVGSSNSTSSDHPRGRPSAEKSAVTA
jgi:hypothetical protein